MIILLSGWSLSLPLMDTAWSSQLKEPSGCDQLVRTATHIAGNQLDRVMIDAPDIVGVSIGIHATPLQWINSYLSGREHFVIWNQIHSSSLSLNIGVPQGSILWTLIVSGLHYCMVFLIPVIFCNPFSLLMTLSQLLCWSSVNKITPSISPWTDLIYATSKGLYLKLLCSKIDRFLPPVAQPTFALVRVVRGDYPCDINCPIPPAYCMLGLLACSEAYEFRQLGTGLSWFR